MMFVHPFRKGRAALIPACLLIAPLFFFAPSSVSAAADLILDAEARITYEDNVVGLLSDSRTSPAAVSQTGAGPMAMTGSTRQAGGMGGGKKAYTGAGGRSPGDLSMTISAEGGVYRDAGAIASIFARGFTGHTAYETYSELDSTIAGIAAGAVLYPSRNLSARLSVFAQIKEYEDSPRNSASYGGSVSVKEALTNLFWIREYAQVERNTADSPDFSYDGWTVGIEAGYTVARKNLLTLGISHQNQKYDDAASSVMTADTVSFGYDRFLTKQWSAGASLDVQTSRPEGGTSTTNHILSVMARYSY